MKRIFGVTALSLVLQATSCGTTYQAAVEEKINTTNEVTTDTATSAVFNDVGNGYFTELLSWDDLNSEYKIVYANDSKVKYFIFQEGYVGGITPLYNANGSLQVYDDVE